MYDRTILENLPFLLLAYCFSVCLGYIVGVNGDKWAEVGSCPAARVGGQAGWPNRQFDGFRPMLLTGTYSRSLDDKNRMGLPKRVRELLGEPNTLFVTPGPDQCLWLFTQTGLEQLAEKGL